MFFLLASLALVRAQTKNPNCFDAVSTCVKLEQLGYCKTNDLVREKCPVSCDTCPTPSPTPSPGASPTPVPGSGTAPPAATPTNNNPLCSDTDPSCCDTVTTCAGFQRAGACQKGSQAIRQICRNTCSFCSDTIVCAKSTFDCYAVQMACANQIKAAGLTLTAQRLIDCVLPEAERVGKTNPEDCCYKWTQYQSHCQTAGNSKKCECNDYEDYHAWQDNGQSCSPDGTQKPGGGPIVRVRHAIFKTESACQDTNGRKLSNAYTYDWDLSPGNCNEKYPVGSVSIACGPNPGTLEETYYKREGCKGKVQSVNTITPSKCEPYQKKYSAKFTYTPPAECGTIPTIRPTKAPVAKGPFTSFKQWKNFCKKKEDKAACTACGGKWKANKATCKVPSKAPTKMKCKSLGPEVCSRLNCTLDTSSRKARCGGGNNGVVDPAWL